MHLKDDNGEKFTVEGKIFQYIDDTPTEIAKSNTAGASWLE